jgi:hypothetical protein
MARKSRTLAPASKPKLLDIILDSPCRPRCKSGADGSFLLKDSWMFASFKKGKAQAEAEAAVGMVIKSLTHRFRQPDAQLDDRFWDNNYFMGFLLGLVGCCWIKHFKSQPTGLENADLFRTVVYKLTGSSWTGERARGTAVKIFMTCKNDFDAAVRNDPYVRDFNKGVEQGKVFFGLVMGVKLHDENDETVIKGRQIDAAMNRMLGQTNSGGAGYLQLTLKAEYERCYGKIEFA